MNKMAIVEQDVRSLFCQKKTVGNTTFIAGYPQRPQNCLHNWNKTEIKQM